MIFFNYNSFVLINISTWLQWWFIPGELSFKASLTEYADTLYLPDLRFSLFSFFIFIVSWFEANDCPGVETFCIRDGWEEVDKGRQSPFFSSWICREIWRDLFCVTTLQLQNQNPYSYFQGKRSAESDPLVGTAFLTTVQVNKGKITKLFLVSFPGKACVA